VYVVFGTLLHDFGSCYGKLDDVANCFVASYGVHSGSIMEQEV